MAADPPETDRSQENSEPSLPSNASIEALLEHITTHAGPWIEFPKREAFANERQWTLTFARSERDRSASTVGACALDQYLEQQSDGLVLLFLSEKITAFPISRNTRACTAIRFPGPPIDLARFFDLEIAIFPESMEWTVIHTHQDGALGGPYFLWRDSNSM